MGFKRRIKNEQTNKHKDLKNNQMKGRSKIFRVIYDRVVLIRVSAVKRHNDHNNFYKGNTFSWSGLRCRGLVHYQHGVIGCHEGKYGARDRTEIPITP